MLMGAHIVIHARVVLIFLISFVIVTVTFSQSDTETLLRFKSSLNDQSSSLMNWNPVRNPCTWSYENWNGVLCLNGKVWGLKLESMNLSGTVDAESLALLPSLRTISLMNNKFEGPLPNLKKMGPMKSIYLSDNGFSGKIPDDAFVGMSSLKKLYIANNRLSGTIPSSIGALPKLLELRLEANQFEGQIPEFNLHDDMMMKSLSFANNQLEGPIPASLSKMDPSAFTGNKNLCGPPLDDCVLPKQPEIPNNKVQENPNQKKETSLLTVIIILSVAGVSLGFIFAILILLFLRKRNSHFERASSYDDSNKLPTLSYANASSKVEPEQPAAAAVVEIKASSSNNNNNKKVDYGKLAFVRDDIEPFDLQDMLRASAEVLGSGTFGASYKTVISNGQAYVVKRYKQMNNVGREEFHEHMRRLGRFSHPNLLPLTAFYYRKEEKLLLYEFVHNGSLSSKLHANHTAERPGLDWQTRLKIIKGVAKGMDYLHSELPSSILPHGHLKSSNVLIDKSFEPLLTDYALRPLINPENAHKFMVAYKSPEYAHSGKISRKADVWSLGILILELLTGKFPENYLLQGYDSKASLSNWVNNMVKEKRTSEVFDVEMRGAKYSKSEMINLLKIGLSCCEEDVHERIELREVIDKIEELKEGGGGSDYEHFSDGGGYAQSISGSGDHFFSHG